MPPECGPFSKTLSPQARFPSSGFVRSRFTKGWNRARRHFCELGEIESALGGDCGRV